MTVVTCEHGQSAMSCSKLSRDVPASIRKFVANCSSQQTLQGIHNTDASNTSILGGLRYEKSALRAAASHNRLTALCDPSKGMLDGQGEH